MSVSEATTVQATPITESRPNSRTAGSGESTSVMKPIAVVKPVRKTGSFTCATASAARRREVSSFPS